jgi:hypothetical protein
MCEGMYGEGSSLVILAALELGSADQLERRKLRSAMENASLVWR